MLYPIVMGWDAREQEAYAVAQKSILRRQPQANILPLTLDRCRMLKRPIEYRDGRMWCPISQAPMSTEFAISRFAVPFLVGHAWALFVDCDIVCQADIEELFSRADHRYAIQVVKHAYEPTATEKMDGQVQTKYPRKNWSSVMLWNLRHPANKRLTLQALNTWPGRDLHAFKWLNDDEIGELPQEWNYLVGTNQLAWEPKIYHFTNGGPWLPGWKRAPMDEIWEAERDG